MLDFQKLKEILARTTKNVTPEELHLLKRWFEQNEKLMTFKSKNDFVDSKDFHEKFSNFHMDIYDVIIHNDPNYRK